MNQIKTEKKFWDKIWEPQNIGHSLDKKIMLDRNLICCFEQNIDLTKKQSIFEIGCSPGRFLSYFHYNGFDINGIDYSTEGNNQLKNNFRTQGIKDYNVYEEDFLKFKTSKKYDIVMSFGFIEHFDNPDIVFQKHLDLLKKNGKLFIGIPIFKGLTGFLQMMNNPGILDYHNLKIMNLDYFKSAQNKFDINGLKIDYLGGFDVNMIFQLKSYSIKNIFSRIIIKIFKISGVLRILESLKSKYLSSYVIAIYQNG